MKNQHQIIFLGNTAFEIHGKSKRFIEFGKPSNINDQRQLRRHESKYVFVIDRNSGMMVNDLSELRAGYERIMVPLQIAELEGKITKPWEMAHMNKVSKKLGFGIYLADDYLMRCYKGNPVEYDFYGTFFRLDVNTCKLIERDNEQNAIDLLQVPCAPIMGYELNYHPGLKNIDPNDPPDKVCKSIYLDQMVNEDPLGMARKHDISISRLPDLDFFLNRAEDIQYFRKFKGDLEQIRQLEKPNPKQQTKFKR